MSYPELLRKRVLYEQAKDTLAHGFLPVSIAKESRLDYFNALEAYAVHRDLKPFADMIASLEEQQLDRYLGMIERQAQWKQQSE
jgi:hypothetical protein